MVPVLIRFCLGCSLIAFGFSIGSGLSSALFGSMSVPVCSVLIPYGNVSGIVLLIGDEHLKKLLVKLLSVHHFLRYC